VDIENMQVREKIARMKYVESNKLEIIDDIAVDIDTELQNLRSALEQ